MRAIAQGMMTLVVTKQSSSTPMHSMYPIWLSVGEATVLTEDRRNAYM